MLPRLQVATCALLLTGLTRGSSQPPAGFQTPRPMLWMAEGRTTTAAGVRSYNLTRPVVFFLRAGGADLASLAEDGVTLLATIHPAYAPFKTAMNESAVRAWSRAQLSQPFVHGVALDHEGWTLQTAGMLRWLYEEAVAAQKARLTSTCSLATHSLIQI